jgi:hypothetical protein
MQREESLYEYFAVAAISMTLSKTGIFNPIRQWVNARINGWANLCSSADHLKASRHRWLI